MELGILNAGIDAESGEVIDVLTVNVVEPLRSKRSVLRLATETACQILRLGAVRGIATSSVVRDRG